MKADRTGKWGNPFTLPEGLKGEAKTKAQAEAVKAFTEALESETLPFSKEDIRRELKGKNLACWCKPGTPCHADVLLAIANGEADTKDKPKDARAILNSEGREALQAAVLDTVPIVDTAPPEAPQEAEHKTVFTFTHADDLSDTEGAFDFVEDVISDGTASCVYGASNSGKTFFAIDLGAHVATGREWQEKEVEQGAVLYIALEGTQGAVNRIKAMKMRGILPAGSPFYCCFSPVNLLDPTHPAAVVRMIAEIGEAASMPVRLVIIDTMARAMAGGDENSGKDMGQAVDTIDAIRAKTAAHVCIIHHCGKDAAKGARGHSSLRAAIDTEIEVIHPEGDKYRTATIVKQRDLPTITPLCFSLDPVEVGRNRRGKPITSCVVKAEDSIMAHTKGKPGAKQKYTCEMILDLLPQPTVKAWEMAAKETHGMSPDTFGDRKRECASRWENVGNQITVKPLQGKGKWGNGKIQS